MDWESLRAAETSHWPGPPDSGLCDLPLHPLPFLPPTPLHLGPAGPSGHLVPLAWKEHPSPVPSASANPAGPPSLPHAGLGLTTLGSCPPFHVGSGVPRPAAPPQSPAGGTLGQTLLGKVWGDFPEAREHQSQMSVGCGSPPPHGDGTGAESGSPLPHPPQRWSASTEPGAQPSASRSPPPTLTRGQPGRKGAQKRGRREVCLEEEGAAIGSGGLAGLGPGKGARQVTEGRCLGLGEGAG